MNKEEIATFLENLAKTLRKDSVKVNRAGTDIDMFFDNIEISGSYDEDINITLNKDAVKEDAGS